MTLEPDVAFINIATDSVHPIKIIIKYINKKLACRQ